jgi:hypothetical protein
MLPQACFFTWNIAALRTPGGAGVSRQGTRKVSNTPTRLSRPASLRCSTKTVWADHDCFTEPAWMEADLVELQDEHRRGVPLPRCTPAKRSICRLTGGGGGGGDAMIEDELQRLHGVLRDAYHAMSDWQSVLPVGTSIDTAFALGKVLLALAKATELVGQVSTRGDQVATAFRLKPVRICPLQIISALLTTRSTLHFPRVESRAAAGQLASAARSSRSQRSP